MNDLLHKIKDRHTIAYWREQAGAIGSKEQVALAVDRPQKIGELYEGLASIYGVPRAIPTLKSVFIFSLRQLDTLRQNFVFARIAQIQKDKARISDSPIPYPKRDSRYASIEQARPGILQKTKGDSGGSSNQAAHHLSPFLPESPTNLSTPARLIAEGSPVAFFAFSHLLKFPSDPHTHHVDNRDRQPHWHCQCKTSFASRTSANAFWCHES